MAPILLSLALLALAVGLLIHYLYKYQERRVSLPYSDI
jgi:hypothetical protein